MTIFKGKDTELKVRRPQLPWSSRSDGLNRVPLRSQCLACFPPAMSPKGHDPPIPMATREMACEAITRSPVSLAPTRESVRDLPSPSLRDQARRLVSSERHRNMDLPKVTYRVGQRDTEEAEEGGEKSGDKRRSREEKINRKKWGWGGL